MGAIPPTFPLSFLLMSCGEKKQQEIFKAAFEHYRFLNSKIPGLKEEFTLAAG